MDFRPLYFVDKRIETFKMWPFGENEPCNERNMAMAGFYSMAAGSEDADAAKCFLCGKEMDGWEATDDPWAEHRGHAPHCAFVQLNKKEDDLLLLEFLSTCKQYMINEIQRMAEINKEVVEEKAKSLKKRCPGKK